MRSAGVWASVIITSLQPYSSLPAVAPYSSLPAVAPYSSLPAEFSLPAETKICFSSCSAHISLPPLSTLSPPLSLSSPTAHIESPTFTQRNVSIIQQNNRRVFRRDPGLTLGLAGLAGGPAGPGAISSQVQNPGHCGVRDCDMASRGQAAAGALSRALAPDGTVTVTA
eukprot:764778-Hanusia_phi.AAC.2